MAGRMAILAALVLAAASPAGAQGLAAVPNTMAPIYMNSAIGLIGIDAARRANEAQARRAARPGAEAVRPAAPAVAAVPGAFAIGTDPQVSDQARDQFFARFGSAGQAARAVAALYTARPVRQAFLAAAAPYGLTDADMRDVTTAHFVTAWTIVNGAPPPTRAQVQGVRAQVAARMETSRPPAAARERQMAAEQMMYDVTAMLYAQEAAARTGTPEAGRQLAAQTAESYVRRGFDLRRVALTDRGFVPR
ncbi:hypothetical protein BN1110_04422 [bacterium YEK0313]|nr:hypothetical protein BN1110_04422 [bacterium YEK0313]